MSAKGDSNAFCGILGLCGEMNLSANRMKSLIELEYINKQTTEDGRPSAGPDRLSRIQFEKGNIMKSSLKRTLMAAVLAISCGALGWVTLEKSALGGKPEKISVPIAVNDAPLARETKLNLSFAPIAKRVGPSVVNVFTTKTVRSPEMRPFFDDPMFRRFFREPFGDGERGSPRQPRTFKERSLGSGVIVTKDGYILTNNHVVDGADEVKVARDKEKKEYTAKVVGRDPKTDIAVLKIDATDLPFVTLADSDKIEVGDMVLAIGNPFGVGQTVTMGIISAVGRGGMGIEDYEDFIQTDAAINPGNSGGALVDAEGRLIGINTAILSRTGGNQGVGFAVPVNLARNVMEHLIQDGKMVRGFLGVSIQDLSPELAKQFNVPDSGGALIGGMTEKSAAAEAGLKSGDVIIELDGKPVKDSRSLRLAVGRMGPGTKVRIKVLRDEKEKTFTVTLREMPEQKLTATSESNDNESDEEALKGVGVSDLDSAARSQFNIPDQVKGAMITEVDPDSASYEAGLRQGDVIQEINHQAVTSAEDAVKASQGKTKKSTLVRVWSKGGSRYVVVDESKAK
jgi:serine protease Do